jgi:hypothetical protein
MKLKEVKSWLRDHPASLPRFILPDGNSVLRHFHLTEVGYVEKNFVDCGGTKRRSATCVVQTYVADDLDHRLTAEKMGSILELGGSVLPGDEFEMEVEYDCCVISQYPIESAEAAGEYLDFHLAGKHTDCLAKDKCGIDEGSPESATAAACCG